MKVSIITLGCKVNEYESLSMVTQLKNAGFEVSLGLEFADIYILNSCAVTNMAERKSRQMIAKILKINSNANIIVTGCASQNNPKQFENYENVKVILGTEGKNNILDYINKAEKAELKPISNCYENFPYATKSKTRHYIKIQDGCNNFCSYCIIPYTRGRSRSRDKQDILNEIKQSDAREFVLTGINVSDYKIDGKHALIDLLEEIDKLNVRFRLSSLECVIIDENFIERLSKLNNFCPFFHLSLQSACNSTLKRMNRHYTIEQYIEVCNNLKENFPNCCISTDLIVGFKGETDQEFNETMANLNKIPFAFIHIFPYSVRKGTNAEKFSGDVSSDVIKQRESKLIEYNNEIYNKFLDENIGKNHYVLIEKFDGRYSIGYSENYVYTYIEEELEEGTILLTKAVSKFKDGLLAEIVKKR
ncbi:MAG: tRNA (N(6)-L-threonylcarbamoyladenosine(37)-C(2))-methylthiotransferase MtaB [Clostridia bacterium]|nr:tRNA (N(6)-L-threonylcarbamoyladenosine(37)-C(2))-methylthiotransferase MtaB [Clostridia bacterium]